MPEKEYILFCDESEKYGKFFSHFYGGVLVAGSQYKQISDRLNALKIALNLYGEVKWEKITERYLTKYQQLIQAFFQEVAAGRLKVRIMFTQNAHEPRGLSTAQVDLEYFLLYYQFIKHGFGLTYLDNAGQEVFLRLYFDQFPDTAERAAQFKGYLHALQQSALFARAKLRIRPEDIVEVRSHEHVLLQCLDIVLGSVAFRLNERHKQLVPGTRRRGSRTVAKEQMFKSISVEIRRIRPGFNIGISTGLHGKVENGWLDAYRHWCFKASTAVYNQQRTKHGQKKNPTRPTSISDA